MYVLSYESWESRDGDEVLKSRWLEDFHGPEAGQWARVDGECTLCMREVRFALASGTDPVEPNVREHLLCPSCGLNARVRAALSLLRRSRHGEGKVYLTEQATPAFVWAQRHLPGPVLGSEYQPDPAERRCLTRHLHRLGGTGEVQFGDVTELGFSDGELDSIVSMDVLEHVPAYEKALHEFCRVLAPGGMLIATFPFCDRPDTVVLARLRNGEIEHLREPEYHGDPLGGGVLCWYHFGWDVLDACRRAGFSRVRMDMPLGRRSGFRYGLWTLVAEH